LEFCSDRVNLDKVAIIERFLSRCERNGMAIPTMQCKLEEKKRKTMGMKCEVKSAVNCNCSHK
jgi:hypothetical protein